MIPFNEKLYEAIIKRNSSLCVGIDPCIDKLPESMIKQSKINPAETLEKFCKQVIISTAPHCCAFKLQIAMFSSIGCESVLEIISKWIRKNFPDHILIIDAKRGDIGSTAEHYVSELYDRYNAQAATINPLMGTESISPFLARRDKGLYILCRTSNPGANEIQNLRLETGERLFEKIASIARDKWNKNFQIGLVVGATVPEELKTVRKLCPNLPLLIPGVGAQGGSISEVIKSTIDAKNVLINSSRSIIFASKNETWAAAASNEAQRINNKINKLQSSNEN